jgi:hypothetical protein
LVADQHDQVGRNFILPVLVRDNVPRWRNIKSNLLNLGNERSILIGDNAAKDLAARVQRNLHSKPLMPANTTPTSELGWGEVFYKPVISSLDAQFILQTGDDLLYEWSKSLKNTATWFNGDITVTRLSKISDIYRLTMTKFIAMTASDKHMTGVLKSRVVLVMWVAQCIRCCRSRFSK